MRLSIVKENLALKIKTKKRTILLVADLHFGYSYELKKRGINARKILFLHIEKFKKMIEDNMPQILIILGDLKHNIPYASYIEKKIIADLNIFFKKLSIDTILVKGNHDGGIEKYFYPTKVLPASGGTIFDMGFFHGHANPNSSILKSKIIFSAHIHPIIRISKNQSVFKEKIFLSGTINFSSNIKQSTRFIILPAFNPLLLDGLVVNELNEPEKNFLTNLLVRNANKFDITLADGSYFGKLHELQNINL